jgi:hypothetical protein
MAKIHKHLLSLSQILLILQSNLTKINKLKQHYKSFGNKIITISMHNTKIMKILKFIY